MVEQGLPNAYLYTKAACPSPGHLPVPHQTGKPVRTGFIGTLDTYQDFTATRKTPGLPDGSVVKNPPAMQEPQETWVRSLGQEDPLKKEMATHFSIFAWEIPRTEELQSMGLQELHTI